MFREANSLTVRCTYQLVIRCKREFPTQCQQLNLGMVLPLPWRLGGSEPGSGWVGVMAHQVAGR